MKLSLVSIQRPLFRGDKAAAVRQSAERLEPVAQAAGFALEVCPDGVATPSQAGEVAARLAAAPPALLLLQATTFATFDCYEPFLALACPTVVWGLPEPQATGPLPLNSFCGTQFVASQEAFGPTRTWLYGLPDDPVWAPRWTAVLAAARALARLRRARVLWVGGTAPTFGRFAAEPRAITDWCGATVESCELSDLFGRVAEVSDRDAAGAEASLVAEGADRLSPAQLASAARLEVGLRHLTAGYDAVALRCWPECASETGSMPCASVGRLFDQGCPTACEGDLLGALSLLAIGAVAEHDPVLLDLAHLTAEHLIFWHCGNAPRSLAADGSRLGTHFNRPDTGCVREMTLAAGPTTMLRFTEPGAGVWFEGDWLPGGPDFDGVSGRLGEVRWQDGARLDPAAVATRVMDGRLPHHFAFGPGHHGAAVDQLFRWLGCRDGSAQAAVR